MYKPSGWGGTDNVTNEPSEPGPSSLTPCSREKPLASHTYSFGLERSKPRGDWTEHSPCVCTQTLLKIFYFHFSVPWGLLLLFGELGIKPIPLNFVGKCSTTKLNPQPLTMLPARNWIQRTGLFPSDFSITFTKLILYSSNAERE